MVLKKFISVLLLTIISAGNLFAQQTSEVELADVMRSNGKIFVVVGVIAVVFTGIVVYLISIDKKVSRLEKKVSEKN